MSESVMPNADAVAQELAALLKGKLDQDKIDAAVKTMQSLASAYPANVDINSSGNLQVSIDTGETFTSQGGLFPPNGGTSVGAVFTSDIDTLYADTLYFMCLNQQNNLNVAFLDSNANTLGTYVGTGIPSLTGGTYGGDGSWS